jgi:hypothetical protein
MKVCGAWQTVYYPIPATIVYWILLIFILWAPQFVLCYMIRRFVGICDKQLNPKVKEIPVDEQLFMLHSTKASNPVAMFQE